ncbi:bile acid:sodium symporter family protein [Nocardioides jishulii]|uniref:Bile acid:sodium symporter family protein n=1 Tax=Nocardioides jishulii TaxID=2575440 RepID=A0A4U2YJK1_9ACTN|nr:bile acid:sodium symporter family protein [Nocardioides jishulii]QCX26863.1 bile acid:sodium symporter family protein [Nocardioides jishulii]TKI61346.1 bile acid:sodium symporter family protein [Nocardioides jishulii]
MDSALTTIGLPVALGIIMFGLGLDLTVNDFKRVGRHPRAAVIALVCQLLLLPAICFGLVVALDLSPLLGIGLMLLAASPGGTTAALFSHLYRGDVALNITLTAVNSLIAILTLPLITGFAIAWYDRQDDVTMPLGEVLNVFALILVPVGLGMLVRAKKPGFAQRMDKPVRIASAIILVVLILGVIAAERAHIGDYLAQIGVAAALFCAISLAVGYFVPKSLGVPGPQAISSSMEIGVHNSTLAIFVAVEVLDNTEISVPAAVYSIIMFVFAAAWGSFVSRRESAPQVQVDATV